MKLVAQKYPQYLVFHEMLGLKIVGIKEASIAEARKPEERLQELLKAGPTDELSGGNGTCLNDSNQQFRVKNRELWSFRLNASWFSSSKIFRY